MIMWNQRHSNDAIDALPPPHHTSNYCTFHKYKCVACFQLASLLASGPISAVVTADLSSISEKISGPARDWPFDRLVQIE